MIRCTSFQSCIMLDTLLKEGNSFQPPKDALSPNVWQNIHKFIRKAIQICYTSTGTCRRHTTYYQPPKKFRTSADKPIKCIATGVKGREKIGARASLHWFRVPRKSWATAPKQKLKQYRNPLGDPDLCVQKVQVLTSFCAIFFVEINFILMDI